ncbi:MAG TPA: hypothetical protein IAC62_15725 [Candidatus Pelethocola excrementipullorum]|nr:hypothetical protein [Candidatus Pelethocola excrementipullorum]
MKGTKKLFATILATVMMLCMGVTAFATETDPTPPKYTDMSEVTITKKYVAENANTTSPAETFTVEQVGEGVVINGEATTAPDLGEIIGATFAEGEANGTEAKITITLPEYTNVGVYEYILNEVVGKTAGVTYYGKQIKLVVTVIQDGKNRLRVAGVHTEIEGDKSDIFENTYSAGTLSVNKTVEGNLGDQDKYFEFRVTLTGEEGKTYADSYKVTGGSRKDNPTYIKIGEETIFYLKHNETLSILNLPYDVSYTVVETDYSKDGYTTSVSGVDKVLEGEGTIETGTQTVEFVNTKKGEVDTGINLDSLPYILVFGGVIVAAVVMIARKRRISD